MTRNTYWYLLIPTLALLTSTPVAAQSNERGGSGAMRFEGHGTLSTHEGIGGGLRLELPVIPHGPIPRLNNDISITAGADLILFFDDDDDNGRWDRDHDDEGVGIWPMVAVQWNFYLSNEWSVFPELGLWLQLGEDGHGHHDDDINMDLLLGVGARYHLGGRSSIFLRLEHPFLVHIGVQF